MKTMTGISAAFCLAVSLLSCEKEDPFSFFTNGGNDVSVVAAGDDSAGSDIAVDAPDDDIARTSFDLEVSVLFGPGGASVTGADATLEVSVSGNDVTVTNTGDKVVRYTLSGTAADGFFKLYSSRKQALVLNGLSLTNPSGAAINNQSRKRTFVVLKGTSSLADGAAYGDETDAEDMKAAFFSEGQLVFSGTGSLTVEARGKAGITSDDYVRFMGSPSVSVRSAAGHGVRGKQAVIISSGDLDIRVSATGKKGISSDTLVYVGGGSTRITSTAAAGLVDDELTGAAGIKADLRFEMTGGELTVDCSGSGAKGITGDNVGYFKGGTVTVSTTGANYGSSRGGGFFGGPGASASNSDDSKSAKGIKFDGNLYFSGADVTVNCKSHEGIEAKGVLKVTGGSVYSNAPSDDAFNSGGEMTLSGGCVYACSTGNDGLDANGNLTIEGGLVYAVGAGNPEVALDANTERGFRLYIKGGTVLAFGGLESGASITQPCLSTSWSREVRYAVYDGDTQLMTFTAPAGGGSGMVLSHPSFRNSSDYTLLSGVTVSGGMSLLGGAVIDGPQVSEGKSVSLTASTSVTGNGGMGGGMGGPGFGR